MHRIPIQPPRKLPGLRKRLLAGHCMHRPSRPRLRKRQPVQQRQA
jgi:hypothetical protein